jgi:hypothetical protein
MKTVYVIVQALKIDKNLRSTNHASYMHECEYECAVNTTIAYRTIGYYAITQCS